ncbi:MAG: TOPRIM nucleotidyl transferase/hydrolase domain-containing protein [bacterium]
MIKYSDKLLRFRDPFLNKLKIYREVILKNCVIPRFNSNTIKSLDLYSLECIATEIFNASIKELNSTFENKFDNKLINYLSFENTKFFSSTKLIEEIINSENFFFNQQPGITLDKLSNIENLSVYEINELFSSAGYKTKIKKHPELSGYDNIYISYSNTFSINFESLFDYFDKADLLTKTSLWVKRAFYIWKYLLLNQNFNEVYCYSLELRKSLNFPVSPEIFLIVEGITEEKLLPMFSCVHGFDFAKNGIYLVSAGGKNQVLKMYKDYKDKLCIPIFILFDFDAESIGKEIIKIKREIDSVYIINEGEFEDILTYQLILKSINNSFSIVNNNVEINELRSEACMVNVLNSLWKIKGYGEFSKASFAKMVKDNITCKTDVSSSIENIFNALNLVLKNKNGEDIPRQ